MKCQNSRRSSIAAYSDKEELLPLFRVVPLFLNNSGTMPLFVNSGMNTAIIEDESGKDAVLSHTNYSRLRHPFPIVYSLYCCVQYYV